MAKRKAIVPEVGKFYRVTDLDADFCRFKNEKPKRAKLDRRIVKVLRIYKNYPVAADCLLLDPQNGETRRCKYLHINLFCSEIEHAEACAYVEMGISEIADKMRGFLAPAPVSKKHA